jgi:hypothetical protein
MTEEGRFLHIKFTGAQSVGAKAYLFNRSVLASPLLNPFPVTILKVVYTLRKLYIHIRVIFIQFKIDLKK